MGRPLEFDREEVLEQALHLFREKGYEAASLRDLLDVMELSKSSFYQSFGSKHELFQRCINRYRRDVAGGMSHDLQHAAKGRQFIEQTIRCIAERAAAPDGRWGCLVMNAAGEMAPRDAVIADLVAEGALQFEDVFHTAVERAQGEGDIPEGKNPRVLARYLVSSRSGLQAMARAGASAEALNEVAEVVLSALD